MDAVQCTYLIQTSIDEFDNPVNKKRKKKKERKNVNKKLVGFLFVFRVKYLFY